MILQADPDQGIEKDACLKSRTYKTVPEVLYEVIYQADLPLTAYFKKYTGLTPSEFKRVYKN